jgi:hypothetical protein
MPFLPITFASPWLLAGLAALPVIWWLLRFTPPAPARVEFPAARLLEGLRSKERTPARSPWWLTALRILAAALIVLALSGPLYNPNPAALPGGEPLLIVVDDGWAAASRWKARQNLMLEALRQAETEKQPVYLVSASKLPPGWRPEPMSAEKARGAIALLTPSPTPVDRVRFAQALENGFANAQSLNVLWLADGVDDGGASAFSDVLRGVAKGGAVTAVVDAGGQSALALFGFIGADKQLTAKVLSPSGAGRTGVVHALSARGERLGETAFTVRPGDREALAPLAMPVDLQNQVARLEIAGEKSAGAVYLLDSRSLRRRVGVITGDPGEGAQPLLSPSHYIQKALAPFAEVTLPESAASGSAVREIMGVSPSVIVLADIGRLPDPIAALLRQWVQNGGMLIRFAGPRMEQGVDDLMPVRLRQGGRTLGGSLSWSTPQKLAPFEKTGPFRTLAAPADVEVNRQILADPAAIASPNQVWARLQDGTPLVTSSGLGKGRLVLFHVTGHPDWSNLPLSGVFIDMLRKTVDESGTIVLGDESAGADTALASAQNLNEGAEFLQPWRTLNGYGELGAPPEGATAISTQAENPRAAPGYYGPPDKARAVNLMRPDTTLRPISVPLPAVAYQDAQNSSLALAPPLFLAALIVFMIDAAVSLFMSGKTRAMRSAAATLSMFIAAHAMLSPAPALAQTAPAKDEPVAAQIMDAALKTRLAYVITGDAAVDDVTLAGLTGLTRVLAMRTAIEPAEPAGVDLETDELAVYPLLYWAIPSRTPTLSDAALAKIDAYMKTGGVIVFDTRDYQSPVTGVNPNTGATALGEMLAKLDLPRLEAVTQEHVVTKSFYILRSFPGRWDGGELWVEAHTNVSDTQTRRGLKSDGVSSILVTSNDLAAAWALDGQNMPLYPAVPGGDDQREMAFRAGVNIVMYALTGNYKADQVHVPALLERLGH